VLRDRGFNNHGLKKRGFKYRYLEEKVEAGEKIRAEDRQVRSGSEKQFYEASRLPSPKARRRPER